MKSSMSNPHEPKTGYPRGRPRKLPAPSLSAKEIIEMRKLLEHAVKNVPEEISQKKSVEFAEAVQDLRPWLLRFLECGYSPANFIDIMKENSFETDLPEAGIKHLFLAAIGMETGGMGQ